MLENITRVKSRIGEREYEFICPQDSPLTDVKEALFRMTKFIGQIEDASNAAQEAAKAKQTETQAQVAEAQSSQPEQAA